MLSKIINEEIKNLIREKKYTKNEIMRKIYEKYGNIGNITFWYDCCYNSVCEELNIDRKNGEEIKLKRKVRLVPKGKVK
jgi:hypothetical protein